MAESLDEAKSRTRGDKIVTTITDKFDNSECSFMERTNRFPRSKDECSRLEAKSISKLELIPLSETAIMKGSKLYMDQTESDTLILDTSNPPILVLCKPQRSVETSQSPVDPKDIKYETSTSDSQNIKYEISTDDCQDEEETSSHSFQNGKKEISIRDSRDIKKKTPTRDSLNVIEQISTCDFQNVNKIASTSNSEDVIYENISNVLISHYNSLDNYVIVEDVEKNAESYCATKDNKNKGIDYNFYQREKPKSNIFAKYQKESITKIKREMKKTKEAKIEYFYILPIYRTESDDRGTFYYLGQSFQCFICHEMLTAAFNILVNDETLMIDQIKNDYLLPYEQEDSLSLVHLNCKTSKYDDDNGHYHCNISSQKKLREPMTMQYWLYVLIIKLLLIASPILLLYKVFLLDSRIFQNEIWFNILYCVLFIIMAINELFRYCKKINDVVEEMQLIVWNAQFNSHPVTNPKFSNKIIFQTE